MHTRKERPSIMLQPKRTRFRKFQKGRIGGVKTNMQSLSFGSFGIKSVQAGQVPARVLEAVRRTLSRSFKRTGRIWIRVFPDIAVSRKPAEVRMGKGKGANAFWMCRVQAGHILFEMDGVSHELAKHASTLIATKFPFPVRFVSRKDIPV